AKAYSRMTDRAQQEDHAGSIFGPKMGSAVHFLLNPTRFGENFEKLSKLGMYGDEFGDAAKAGKSLTRQLKLVQEHIDLERGMRKAAGDLVELAYQRGEIGSGKYYSMKSQLWMDWARGGSQAERIVRENAAKLAAAEPKDTMTVAEQIAREQAARAK